MILGAHTYVYHIAFKITTYDVLCTNCSQVFKAENYTSEALKIIEGSPNQQTPISYIGFRRLVERRRSPFLLLNLGWLHLKMFDEFGALELLKEVTAFFLLLMCLLHRRQNHWQQNRRKTLAEARIAELEGIVGNPQKNDSSSNIPYKWMKLTINQ